MNYIDRLKQKAIEFAFIFLSSAISYTIACHFEWRELIILTPEYMAFILSGSLTYIFIMPLYGMWFDSLKK